MIFLKLKANNDSNIQDVTLKDNREMRKLWPYQYKNQIGNI